MPSEPTKGFREGLYPIINEAMTAPMLWPSKGARLVDIRDQAICAIQDLIEQHIPEKRKYYRQGDTSDFDFRHGYNQAIDDLRQALREGVNNG